MSGRKSYRNRDERQMSFDDYFVVPTPAEVRPGSIAGFDCELRQALSRSLKSQSLSRYEVAAKMSEMLGDDISKNMLDAYTAESRETHQISVVRLVAMILATKDYDLLAMIAEKVGCRLLVGEEAIGAEIGFIDQEIEELRARRAQLKKMSPVSINRGRT
ncbi:MAG: hypothetical protein M0R28_24350 [Pigmentiphaga sp.]|nr:hypothetical protein [Pigmentiphaga sp.]